MLNQGGRLSPLVVSYTTPCPSSKRRGDTCRWTMVNGENSNPPLLFEEGGGEVHRRGELLPGNRYHTAKVTQTGMSGERLPLFPLNVVLFPSSSLPLHIFEERYKTLIKECFEKRTVFGINLLRSQGMEEVGCSASVVRVTRTYDDGRMDVVVRGERIYRLTGMVDADAPYAIGTVEYLTDLEKMIDSALAEETVRLFGVIQRLVAGKEFTPDHLSEGTPRLSFIIARKAGLDLDARQRLLEMRDENDRLDALRRHLEVLIPLLEKKEELDRLKQNDGYL
jgi:Lon protease-like protein